MLACCFAQIRSFPQRRFRLQPKEFKHRGTEIAEKELRQEDAWFQTNVGFFPEIRSDRISLFPLCPQCLCVLISSSIFIWHAQKARVQFLYGKTIFSSCLSVPRVLSGLSFLL